MLFCKSQNLFIFLSKNKIMKNVTLVNFILKEALFLTIKEANLVIKLVTKWDKKFSCLITFVGTV